MSLKILFSNKSNRGGESIFTPPSNALSLYISNSMYNPEIFLAPFLFFEIISVLAIQKTHVTRQFKAKVSKLPLEKILGTVMTPCGTQITHQNKNVVFFKGFSHGAQILKLVHGCCLAKIWIFGAQSWDSQLSNDVSHVILAFLHMNLF